MSNNNEKKDKNSPLSRLRSGLALTGITSAATSGLELLGAKKKFIDEIANDVVAKGTFVLPTMFANPRTLGMITDEPDLEIKTLNDYKFGQSSVKDNFLKTKLDIANNAGSWASLNVSRVSPKFVNIREDVLAGVNSLRGMEKLKHILQMYGKPALTKFLMVGGIGAVPVILTYLFSKLGERDRKQIEDDIIQASQMDVEDDKYKSSEDSLYAQIAAGRTSSRTGGISDV